MPNPVASPLNWFPPLPPWVSWAVVELSKEIQERPGEEANHPRIIEYFDHVNYQATSDEVSWCSTGLCCCFHEVGLPSTMSAAARSWDSYGVELQHFRFGCICVFWRESPQSWKGHVGIGLRETEDYILVLGANQGDQWSIERYSKSRLLSFRWPDAEDYDFRNYYPMWDVKQ